MTHPVGKSYASKVEAEKQLLSCVKNTDKQKSRHLHHSLDFAAMDGQRNFWKMLQQEDKCSIIDRIKSKQGETTMPTEKKMTGYPSIDKPWLKYYTEDAINAQLPEWDIDSNE